jgi:hypothetical protein
MAWHCSWRMHCDVRHRGIGKGCQLRESTGGQWNWCVSHRYIDYIFNLYLWAFADWIKTGDATSTPPDPSSLSLTYLRPINANSIYVMRAQMTEKDISGETSLPPQKDLTKKQRDERSSITHQLNKKYEVNGTIENMEGKVCVKALAVWDILWTQAWENNF